MNENPTPADNIVDELKNLGKNIGDLFLSAWDAPESKRFKMEIENGLNNIGESVKREVDNFSESPTGQRLKGDMDDFGERIRNAEMRDKVREEVLSILHTANDELRNLISNMSPGEPGGTSEVETPPQPEDSEDVIDDEPISADEEIE